MALWWMPTAASCAAAPPAPPRLLRRRRPIDRHSSRPAAQIFVDVEPDVRLARRIRRDMASRGRDLSGILQQYSVAA